MRKIKILLILIFLNAMNVAAQDVDNVQAHSLPKSEITQVVFLGTGTPFPDPNRSGPSLAIVVNDTPYIVDFGPGLVRRAAQMSPMYGGDIPGLAIQNLKRAFLTHLHSDHTVGFPDLIFSPWVLGRDEPLLVYGPEGTRDMANNILKAYEVDINYRLYSLEPANNQGWRVEAHDIMEEGVIYEDENVKVEAFPVPHGSWPNAYGYRFTTPDRSIVISGDSAPSENVIKYAQGADILIHEVMTDEGLSTQPEFWQDYHRASHTTTVELAQIAEQAKPQLLILYHSVTFGLPEESLVTEIGQSYGGEVVLADDLDVY